MGVFSRLADIVNSNINSILDRAEDPEKIVRLIIQEMEETLVEVRATAARSIAEKKDIERQLKRCRNAQSGWQDKAELAMRKGREDLAKAALIEKAKLSEAAQAMEEDLAALEAALGQGEADIGKLEAKLQEAKTRQKAMQARQETANNRLRTRRAIYDRRVEDALMRFESVERRIDRTESVIEAYEMGRPKSTAEQLAELEADAAIEDELAALKARLHNSTASGERA
ncbi:MAG: phage shock protein PspA [Rhodospirillales bacterium]|nr:phage shock protein PspA [Rhodospirillales bacterium]